MLLSVVTGTVNRIEHLKAMMESVTKGLPPNFVLGEDYEFCVCAGPSTDGTIEFLKDHKGVRLVEHGELRGAIAAFNDAAKVATGDYLLIANDDITFDGYSVARGLAYAMEFPDVGCSCFYQDRNNQPLHYEKIPVYFNGESEPKSVPYMQVGVIPRWLWEQVGGWGDGRWGSKTYGGDTYLSMRVYEAGYKVIPVAGCSIKDKTVEDSLRQGNYAAEFTMSKSGAKGFWGTFPKIEAAVEPAFPNPLGKRKRVLYAPIIEVNHVVQKEQKRGLRDALEAIGAVWEVDYIYSHEDVALAAEVWSPNLTLTQFHDENAITKENVGRIKRASLGHICNWVGDVWPDQQLTPKFMDILRLYDYHLVVNATLVKKYADVGIRAAYWQNSFEPQILDNPVYLAPVEAPENKTRLNPPEVIYDVIFLGNCYSNYRSDLAYRLKSIPNAKVAIFGSGYPTGVSEGQSLYNYAKTGNLYRSAKLIIADNQYLEATGFASDRLFMALASGGGMLLHQEVGGMQEYMGLVDKLHYVSWSNTKDLNKDFKDLTEKIAYYLEHDEERRRIAAMGTAECRKNHTYAARVGELQNLLSNLKPRRTTISACLIFKNEEANVDRVLSQLDACMDEIVIVDTGSTDNTVQKIQEFKGRILPRLFFKDWTDNFSDARNFAKEHCTGDFIFWMDGDDVLDDELVKQLARFDEWKTHKKKGVENPMGFKFTCIDGRNRVLQTRLFRNLPPIKWDGRIHELVDWAIRLTGGEIFGYRGLSIHHNGGDAERRMSRFKRNTALLEAEPDGWCKWHYMAQAYAGIERYGDALLYAERALECEDIPDIYREYFIYQCGEFAYSFGDLKRAKHWFQRSSYPDALYSLAMIMTDEGTFPYGIFKKFLEAEIPSETPSRQAEFKETAKEYVLKWLEEEAGAVRKL